MAAKRRLGGASSTYDMMAGLALTVLAAQLLKGPSTAEEISSIGNAFSQSIRAAQGKPLTLTADERLAQFEREYMTAEDPDLAELEARLDRGLGLTPSEPKRARPHRSVLTGLVSRRRLPGDPLRWLD